MRPYAVGRALPLPTITDSKVAVSESPRRLNLDGRSDAAAVIRRAKGPIYVRLEAPGTTSSRRGMVRGMK
jgi:hypothetical protein